MPRALEKQPATKADVAQMSEYLGERIGNLEKRVDRVEATLQKHSEILETHSKLLTSISRTVDRIDAKLSAPGGLVERMERLETRVMSLERVARRAR